MNLTSAYPNLNRVDAVSIVNACRQQSYPVGSGPIYGYGLPAY